MIKKGIATVAQLDDFSDIIDVRSPLEFAEDHVPGALNCPALTNEQRVEIGTLYKQVSPFAAKKRGAAYVAENIAAHLRSHFMDKPEGWRPLVLCWRGGKRSGSFVTVFRQIGWDAHQLEGGYKAYRSRVVQELATLPARFDFRVICGPTGSAKSRLLEQLAIHGAQVLDLEGLAAHKGSVLGCLPDIGQPSQKHFETRLWDALRRFDPARPVYVEAESRKIGRLHIPEQLIMAIRGGQCTTVSAPVAARVEFLLRDYDYFLQAPESLQRQLGYLKGLYSQEVLQRWYDQVNAGEFAALVAELLTTHYDPLYHRSQGRNFRDLDAAGELTLDDLTPATLATAAQTLLQRN